MKYFITIVNNETLSVSHTERYTMFELTDFVHIMLGGWGNMRSEGTSNGEHWCQSGHTVDGKMSYSILAVKK